MVNIALVSQPKTVLTNNKNVSTKKSISSINV